MLLTETHCHTAEVSLCARVPAAEIPALYHAAGYGAIIVTDHYNLWTLAELADGRQEQIERWLVGYRAVRAAGQALGLTVLLGMELALPGGPEDYLLYGVEESFLFRYPDLVECNLAQVFEIAKQEGLMLYQAHPCREYLRTAEPTLLHGVEVFNGNPRHDSHNDRAAAFAQRNALRKIAGSDFHQSDDLGRAGIFLPDIVDDNKKLVSYLAGEQPELYVSPAALADEAQ